LTCFFVRTSYIRQAYHVSGSVSTQKPPNPEQGSTG
jgi:hypothetical protein